MTCLSQEQLAQLALGLEEDASVTAHLHQCPRCQANLAEMRSLTDRLSTAHAALDHAHAASRARLLDQLPNLDRRQQNVGIHERVASLLAALTTRRRVAIGGVGLATVVGVVLILLALQPARQLSAMERIVNAVREVTSYSFNLSQKVAFLATDDRPGVVKRHFQKVYWRAPGAGNNKWSGDFRADMKGWKVKGVDSVTPPADGELTFELTEIHPTGKPGIVILYTLMAKDVEKIYFRCLPMLADDIYPVGPIAKLRAVKDRSGEVVRELGTKEISGREAHGYVLRFKEGGPFLGDGDVKVEVWVDPATDLPIEFSYPTNNEELIAEYRVTDCRWNIELDPELFDTTPPEGFTDTTPPTRQEDIDQITAALRLYAQLSGGHYPQVTDFDGAAIRKEMEAMAGDQGREQIDQVAPGLDWLTRILLDKVRTGYNGSTVGPQDRDKLLLWWTDSATRDTDRIFFGDLRSEVVTVEHREELQGE